MNILIPHEWLLEHLDTKATPTEIQKHLSLCGPSIERIYEREGESVYDIEVTTNRVDSMSVRGIAREAAVILNQFGIKAKLKPFKPTPIIFNTKSAPKKLKLPTIINNPKFCQRIVCVALADVQRAETPKWMAKRLRQVDMNVHDAVIDITNYITHELGHPCHAFDYDKIMELGGTIIAKEAEAGKKFTTLDGVEYTTVGGELVYENDQGVIIDLPGIKGTANTAIQDGTKNVLFWIEDVTPKKIRFASMTHAIRTVAAQINEKNVDPHLALPVLEEGTKLFQVLCKATIASKLYDEFPGQRQMPTVEVSTARIAEYLGVELPVNRIAEILEELGCGVTMKKSVFTVLPPTFRPDIAIPADVIEEIARIYGYHNLPSVLMATPIPLNKPKHTNFDMEHRVKRFMAAIGWQEVYTYSMVSAEIAAQSGHKTQDHLQLQNPLTDDRIYLRRSLVPSLKEILDQNTQFPELSVFEFANTYTPIEKQLPNEALHLTLVSRKNLRAVKGDLEVMLRNLYVTGLEYRQEGNTKALILVDGKGDKKSGKDKEILGEVTLVTKDIVAVDLTVAKLIEVSHVYPRYQPLAKTNAVIEDLTFTIAGEVTIAELLSAMKNVSPLIRNVEFLNQYKQNVSFRITYHDTELQISDVTVTKLRKEMIAVVEKTFEAKLVGGQ